MKLKPYSLMWWDWRIDYFLNRIFTRGRSIRSAWSQSKVFATECDFERQSNEPDGIKLKIYKENSNEYRIS